jgi:hypothetical protein
MAAPRGLSQPSTSFFGVLRQGILYVRLSNFLRLHTPAPMVQECDLVQLTSYWLITNCRLSFALHPYLQFAAASKAKLLSYVPTPTHRTW